MLIKSRIYFYVFLIGAVLYSTLEVAFRGYTHWTMFLAGGVIFLLIYLINKYLRTNSLTVRCLLSTLIITTGELIAGIVVNIVLNMNVWDYSNQPFNFLGQICLVFTAAWFIVSIPACLLSIFINRTLEK